MDIHALLAEVTLTDVVRIEYGVELKLDPGQSFEHVHDEFQPQGELSFDVNPVSWGKRIELWFRVSVENEGFRLAAAVAALYDRETGQEVPREVQVEFVERVAVMAAFPYLRADVQALSSALRLGDITLGVLRPGDFKVDLNMANAEGPAENEEPDQS